MFLNKGLDSNIIDLQRTQLRIGAFEISIARLVNKIKKVEMLFSKIETRKWPNMPLLLEKISSYLPKTNLMVHLYDSEDNKAESAEGIEGITVKLTMSFKN